LSGRSVIIIRSARFTAPLTFYGHLSGTDNLAAVKRVLSRSFRLGEAGYLAAQIFLEFARLGGSPGELYFGIENTPLPGLAGLDEYPVIVNADSGEVEYCGQTFSGYAIATISERPKAL